MTVSFSYHRPSTLAELFDLLAEPESQIYAGGTDLLVYLRDGKLSPRPLVDIKALSELHGIHETDGGVFIGAAEPVGDVASHPLLERYTALRMGAGAIGCAELRNRATIGGNLCNGSASADSAPGLLVHDARVRLISVTGSRTLFLNDFLLAPGRVDLSHGEVMEGVILPPLAPSAKSRYLRRTRVKGMDLSGISVAVYCEEGLRQIRIAFGALFPTVMRSKTTEAILNESHGEIDEITWIRAATAMTVGANPRRTSLRASPEYKKAMAPVLVRMALEDINGGGFP